MIYRLLVLPTHTSQYRYLGPMLCAHKKAYVVSPSAPGLMNPSTSRVSCGASKQRNCWAQLIVAWVRNKSNIKQQSVAGSIFSLCPPPRPEKTPLGQCIRHKTRGFRGCSSRAVAIRDQFVESAVARLTVAITAASRAAPPETHASTESHISKH